MQATSFERPLPVHLELSKRRITRFFTAAVVLIHLLNIPAVLFKYKYQIDHPLINRFITFFQVSSEGTLPTCYSMITLAICSILLALIALAAIHMRCPFRVHWGILSIIFVIMALDEGLEFHDELETLLPSALETTGPFFFSWVIPASVLVALIGLFYSRFLLSLPSRSRHLFILAAAVYIGGALGMEMVGANNYYQYGAALTYGIIATIEEVFEMSGIVIFIYALLDHLERAVGRMNVSFMR